MPLPRLPAAHGQRVRDPARFPADRVTVEGQSTEWIRVSDDGGRATFRFCPRCGSTVFYTVEALPDAIAIPIGGFADPSFPPPRISVWEERRHAWVSVPEGAERLD